MIKTLADTAIGATCATGDIGDATVRRLTGDGATIVLSGRDADRLAEQEAIGKNMFGPRPDVSNKPGAKALIAGTKAQIDRQDKVWNGAGVVARPAASFVSGKNLLVDGALAPGAQG